MNEDSPERQKEKIQAIQRMTDKLIKLGYAVRAVHHDVPGKVEILFTPRGVTLQNEISRIFESVNAGERFDFDELQAFMVILAMKPRGDVR
jgi:hypothetical protein